MDWSAKNSMGKIILLPGRKDKENEIIP